MSSFILAIIVILVGSASLIAGIKGVHTGRNVSQKDGRDALMHYPAPIPWLRSKVSSARWVSWIGRLYAAAGLALITVGLVTLGETSSDPKLEPCIAVLDAISPENLIDSPITRNPNPKNQIGCQISVVDTDKVTWITVSSTAANTLIGNNFGHQTQELTRKGFTLTPLEITNRRSFLAQPADSSDAGPIFIIENVDGCHAIEFNPNVASETLIEKTISAFRGKLAGNGPGGM